MLIRITNKEIRDACKAGLDQWATDSKEITEQSLTELAELISEEIQTYVVERD